MAIIDSGMFYKRPAWGGLGTVMEHKVSSSQEALELAGADWEVQLVPIVTQHSNILIPGKKAVQRTDNNQILSVVGDVYTPLQNKNAFSFFDPFLHEKDCFIETAGTLKGGRKIWILAKIEGTETEVVPGDEIKNYLLLANSHDGSIKLTVKFVSNRVICENTLKVALDEDSAFKSITHSKTIDIRLSEVQSSLDLVKRRFNQQTLQYRQMTKKSLTTEEYREYLEKVFEADLIAAHKRLEREVVLEDIRACNKILDIYEQTPDLQMDGVRGTTWAAYNSITEYLTHYKSSKSNANSRVDNLWFGKDARLLDSAKEKALSLC